MILQILLHRYAISTPTPSLDEVSRHQRTYQPSIRRPQLRRARFPLAQHNRWMDQMLPRHRISSNPERHRQTPIRYHYVIGSTSKDFDHELKV